MKSAGVIAFDVYRDKGTLHLLTFTTLPDPTTNLRGGTRLVRCLERVERGIGIDFTFLDLGSSGTATAPTLATSRSKPSPMNTRSATATGHAAIVNTSTKLPAAPSATTVVGAVRPM